MYSNVIHANSHYVARGHLLFSEKKVLSIADRLKSKALHKDANMMTRNDDDVD